MGRRWWLAGIAASLACGARTPLLPGGTSGEATSSGGSGGGPTPLAVKCAAALLDGAPTPMRGYCPTRANQAPANAPRAPKVAWSAKPFPIDVPESFLPAEIVVDASGRAYVGIAASPMNPTGAPNQVIAVDPDGSVAWTSTFASPVSSLALASDGNLWLVGRQSATPSPACQGDGGFGDPSTCVAFLSALSPAGVLVAELDTTAPAAPPPYSSLVGYGAMALASDGGFLLESTSPSGSQSGLARAAHDGTLMWQWPPPSYNEYLQLDPPLVVGPADDIVASGSGQLTLFDAAGAQVWQRGSGAQVAAVDAQGDVVALTSGGPTGNDVSLVTIAPYGDTLRTVSLGTTPMNASELALAGDGTTVVLLANEVTSPGLTKAEVQILAVDASGKTRWKTPLDVTLPYDPATLATHYGLFVDGAGTVVVTAGAVTGIDLGSGSVLWTVLAPNAHACVRPAVLGAGGAIVASQCDGTVFLARDP